MANTITIDPTPFRNLEFTAQEVADAFKKVAYQIAPYKRPAIPYVVKDIPTSIDDLEKQIEIVHERVMLGRLAKEIEPVEIVLEYNEVKIICEEFSTPAERQAAVALVKELIKAYERL